eukprot:TRINITY_DN1061_c0_g1_i2.p1 TRINITY_DN1061_c0_g1~~TRINITY_DN1061_c0_g1_i2.p1  ORF type:complete len:652 (-),score=171.58 TRINITY_DN1061_c0_g1_i2:87-2042(-)
MSEQEMINFLMAAGLSLEDARDYYSNSVQPQVTISAPNPSPPSGQTVARPAAQTPAANPGVGIDQRTLEAALKGAGGPVETDPELQKALNASMMDANTANVSAEELQLQKAIEESRKTNFVDLTNNPGGLSQDELQMQRVVEESLMNVGGDTTTLAAISNNPNFRKREFGNAVGLRNVGNTCYVNSLLQTYFHIPEMRRAVLNYPHDIPIEKQGPTTEFMRELQRLFALLVMSKEKWVDPSPLLKKLLDKTGKPVNIGNQEDVSEFNELFLMRVGEGIDLTTPVSLKSSSTSETIKRLFMGTATEVMRYQEENGEFKETSQESVFANLMLPVVEDEPEQDIYSSLDRFLTDEVEYTTDNKFVTTAKKTMWLNRLPSILMFQQNRVKFDIKSKTYVKINTPLTFEPQISLDRFFSTHQKETTDVRKHVAVWREELSELERQIRAITKFNGRNHGIPDALQSVIEYLSTKQTEANVQEQTVKLLEGFLSQEKQKLEELNVRYNDKKTTINTAFDKFPKEHSYSLFAVWVHAGVPGSGHYWAYIRNFHRKIEKKGAEKKETEKKEEDKTGDNKVEEKSKEEGNSSSNQQGRREWGWKRFDDMRITDELNKVVMEQSTGGIGSSTAYFLIYLENELFERLRRETLRTIPVQINYN